MGEGMRNKIRKKILSLLLAGILAAGLCGCGQEAETQKTRVAMIVKSTESAFWKSVFAGAGAAATEYNINVSFDGPAAEEDYETQNEMVRRAMDDGVDVIIFSAVDYNANAEIIDQAAQRGIKIIVIDSDVNSSQVSCRIGTNNLQAGIKAAEAALATDDEELYIGIVTVSYTHLDVYKRQVSRQGQYNYLLKVAEDCEQETAVLYRNNESALPIIDMLERKGLSYRVKNTDMTFFSHPVVNDICDFIHLSLDPWDGETFLRIYYKMGAGISKKAAMEAVDANTGRLTLLDMVAEQEDVSVYTRKQCRALATHLDNMRYETAGRAIYRILNYMGYQEFMDSHGMDSGKAEILKVLGDREESLFDFPKRLQKLQEMIREGCGDPESKFILSTIHSSKGLELSLIHISGLQGASVLDPPEHGLSFQSEGYSVLPEDQYGV